MGQSSSRVQPFTVSEQVHSLPHSKHPKSSTNTAEKQHPHQPDEKPVDVGEEIVLPIPPLKEEKMRKKKKPIPRSVDVIDPEEAPACVLQILPAAESLVQEDVQAEVQVSSQSESR
ncbi:Ribosome-recycling factor [Labeo rohita]|uniref:Ribosome-recycling factor n=1 Tax=Labeo rohita TaxID=84645 RepID=A0ABQ8LZG3_LABRO|nr:Ribosome-recycling factor [Labeo rohita]